MVDTRLVGRRDKPSRAATGAQQYIKLANKALKKARKDITSMADNEFIADIESMVSDVKRAKTIDAAKDNLNKLESKMDGYYSTKKATKKAYVSRKYQGKAGGGKVKKYARGGGVRKAMYK